MKISCTQENLNQGLSIVSHIANKNLNLPILSSVLIKSENKTLFLSATNLEIGITVQVRGKIEKEGEFAVDAKLLTDYIYLLPKERVELEIAGDDLNIECKNQKTKIKKQAASDFPVIPIIEKKEAYIIKASDLKDAINEVAFAVSNSETRPEISGILMVFSGDELTMAATDSYRLAEKKIKLSEPAKQEKKIIVPTKTLQEISRVVGIFKDESLDNAENIEIYITDNQIMFSYNGVDLVSRLIEGQYPDYTQIIPSNHKTQIKANLSDLVKSVKTSSLFTKSGIYDVKLEFSVEDKNITINSSSSQTGENVSTLLADIVGESSNIVLNYRYLLDGLQNIDGDLAVIEMSDSSSPCVIKPDQKNNYVYVIMPIKQ